MSDDDDDGYDWSTAEIQWEGGAPSAEIIAKVRSEIATDLRDLSKPGDLVFHVVMLTADYHGPSVVLWGGDDFNGFCADLCEATDWQTLSEVIP